MGRYFGDSIPKLGFGLMRLPKLANGKIDLEQTNKMVDMFMDAGLNYFDTAYVYDEGGSEQAAKAALVDRYPRESYTLATKLCAWMGAHSEEKAKQQFYISRMSRRFFMRQTRGHLMRHGRSAMPFPWRGSLRCSQVCQI